MKKRLLAILLALSMALTLLPGAALAAEGEEVFPEMNGEVPQEIETYSDIFTTAADVPSFFTTGTTAEPISNFKTFGAQLTGGALEIYEALNNASNLDAIRAGSAVSVTLTDTTENAVSAAVADAVAAFDRDRSDVFWTSGLSTAGSTYSGSTFNLKLTLPLSYSWRTDGGNQTITADESAVSSAVQAIVTEAKKLSTQYDQLAYVHDWLVKNNVYNTKAATTPNYSDTADSTPWEAISALTDGLSPVCEGYSRAFKLVCNELGIPCVLVSGTGTTTLSSGPHMWNYVKLDDAWYAIDVTWDDPTGASESADISREWFLKGSSKFTAANHSPESNNYLSNGHMAFAYPVLSNTDYVVKQAPTCAAPANVTATYGQTLGNITLTNPASNTAGTWTWENSNQSVGDVTGSPRTFKATFTPTDTTAYNTVTGIDVPVAVNAKSIPVTVADIPDQPYTGSAIMPDVTVTSTETVDGYTLKKDTDYTVTYEGNTGVGQATVKITSKSGSNYTFTEVPKTFQITPKPASITINTPGTITYDGDLVTAGTSGADLIYTYTGDSSTINVKWYDGNGTVQSGAPKDAGDYQIGVSAEAGTTSAAVSEVKETFTISPADYTYAGPGAQSVSVGMNHPAASSVFASGVKGESVSGQLTWYTDAGCTVPANGTFSTAGTTTLYWKFTPDNSATNYVSTPKTGSVEFTVDSLPQQTLKFDLTGDQSRSFGDAAFANAINRTETDGGAVTYTSSNPAVATVDSDGEVTITGVGTTVITATAARVDGKYAETSISYTLTVTANSIDPTVTVTGGPFTYTGSEIKPGVSVKAGSTDIPETGYSVAYSNNINAGTATVTVTAAAGGNYTWTAKSQNFTIDKAAAPANQTQPVQVAATATSGEAVLVSPTGTFGTKTYTVGTVTDTDSILSGTPVVDAGGKLTFSLADNLAEKVGKTAAIPVTVSSTNYENYTVTVTVEVVAKQTQAAPAAPVLTYALNADRATYTVTIPAVAGAEYSFDGTNWSDTNVKTDVAPNTAVTGYIRMKETETHLASESSSGSVTTPGIPTMTPQATPAAGSYSGDVTVTLTCGDADAVIYYTTDGSVPSLTAAGTTQRYTGPFTVTPPATVNAFAYASGKTQSELLTVVYAKQAIEPPVIPPYIPDMPSGGGSSSGGSSSGGNQTPSEPSAPSEPSVTPGPSGQEVTAAPKADVSGSTASAAVSNATGRELVDQAVQNGSETVVIAPVVAGSVSRTEVSIPSGVVGDIAGKTSAALKVETPAASVTIPNEALPALAARGGEVTVAAGRDNGIISLEITASGRTVETVSGGVTVTVSEPGCTAGTVAMLMKEDGSSEIIRQSVADASAGTVTVPLDGSARIVLVDNSKRFSDVSASSWASDAVAFVSSRELMNGAGEGAFTPNAPMTRGMLAVVLHNLEGNPDGSVSAAFSDVTGGWYAEAVSWAAGRNIITGYAGGEFRPDGEITREQLAVMLYRYAGSPAVSGSSLPFSDAASVSGYAREAIAWASANGIMSGKGGGVLDPQGGATRAEVAQMLLNFVASLSK